MRALPLALSLVLLSVSAQAADARTICVFDPSGANGDAFNMMKDFRTQAAAWMQGAQLNLRPYTDEKTAAEDLKAGKCHGSLLTGVRARDFNRFAGTLEAMGALRTYAELETLLQLLAKPKAGEKLRGSEYTTAAIFPAGAVYLFVRNRAWDSVNALAGKRIATLDFDQAAITMVSRAGAAMVPADVGTFAGMFNNGHVDAAYAPATAYKPLELEKGLKSGGGIIKVALSHLTFQLLLRNDAGFPQDFAQKAREYTARNMGKFLGVVKRAESAIPNTYWIDVPKEAVTKNEELFRQVRLQLRDKGVFDRTMLTLLRRIRCQKEPGRAECAEKTE